MPKVKCDWDCCKFYDTESDCCKFYDTESDCCKFYDTESDCCMKDDEIVFSTTVIDVVDENGKETGEQLELLECNSFVNYEESEAKDIERKDVPVYQAVY